MQSFFSNICERILNIIPHFLFRVVSKKKSDSFIIEKNDIEILNLSRETDIINATKYLRHHIMYTEDNFHPMYFFGKHLLIRFKYRNEIYQICLKQMESKNTDHSVSMKEPKILSAVMKFCENEENKEKYVTEQLVEFHGPNRNFFKHIPDTTLDFSILLGIDNGELNIFDMMGNNSSLVFNEKN